MADPFLRGASLGARIVGQGFGAYERGVQRREDRDWAFEGRRVRANLEASRRIESAKRRREDVAFRGAEATRTGEARAETAAWREGEATRAEAGRVRRYGLLESQIGARARKGLRMSESVQLSALKEERAELENTISGQGTWPFKGKPTPAQERERERIGDAIGRIGRGVRAPLPGPAPRGEYGRLPGPGRGEPRRWQDEAREAVGAERQRRSRRAPFTGGASGTWE